MGKPFVPPYSPSLPDWMRNVAIAVNYKTDVGTLTAAPARGDWNSINTAFTGDVGANYLTFGRTITGATTLGQPTTGYQNNPETAVISAYLYNSSGWNNGTADNIGRTNCHILWGKVDNYGQGDCSYLSVSGFVTGGRAGATSWLASPAVSAANVALTAGSHGVYLNPFETALDCGAFDAAAVGYVSNITRSTGDTVNGLGAFTAGYRAQAPGAYAVDAAFSASGLHKVGLDLTPTNFDTNKAAIAMTAGSRIYFSAVSSDGFKATSYGTDYIYRTASGMDIVYGGSLAFRAALTGMTIPETGTVPSPPTGYQTLYIDTADHKLKRKDSSGAVTIIA